MKSKKLKIMSSKKYKPTEYIDKILIPGLEKVKEVEPFLLFCNYILHNRVFR